MRAISLRLRLLIRRIMRGQSIQLSDSERRRLKADELRKRAEGWEETRVAMRKSRRASRALQITIDKFNAADEQCNRGNEEMNDQERVKSAQAMKALKEEILEGWPVALERFALMAKIHRAKYDALVKEGFTEAQALELCKVL